MDIDEIIDCLLDEDNHDQLIVNCDGRDIKFEQVAVIPKDLNLYCILKPLEEMEGVADDEAIVFVLDDTGEETVLRPETDEKTAIDIFNIYYDLIEEARGQKP